MTKTTSSSTNKSATAKPATTLEQAPPHVQLAVDLIELLESNQVDNQQAIAALEIVLSDFKRKVSNQDQSDQFS